MTRAGAGMFIPIRPPPRESGRITRTLTSLQTARTEFLGPTGTPPSPGWARASCRGVSGAKSRVDALDAPSVQREPKQLEASAQLVAWLSKLYNIPIGKVDPHKNWRGVFGHVDLRGIDGNNHDDSVPTATGWSKYIKRIKEIRDQSGLPKPHPKEPPQGET